MPFSSDGVNKKPDKNIRQVLLKVRGRIKAKHKPQKKYYKMSDERNNKSVEKIAVSARASFFKKKLEIASLFESYGKEKENFIEREKTADFNGPYGNIPVMRHKIRGKEKYVSKHLGDLRVGERVPH